MELNTIHDIFNSIYENGATNHLRTAVTPKDLEKPLTLGSIFKCNNEDNLLSPYSNDVRYIIIGTEFDNVIIECINDPERSISIINVKLTSELKQFLFLFNIYINDNDWSNDIKLFKFIVDINNQINLLCDYVKSYSKMIRVNKTTKYCFYLNSVKQNELNKRGDNGVYVDVVYSRFNLLNSGKLYFKDHAAAYNARAYFIKKIEDIQFKNDKVVDDDGTVNTIRNFYKISASM